MSQQISSFMIEHLAIVARCSMHYDRLLFIRHCARSIHPPEPKKTSPIHLQHSVPPGSALTETPCAQLLSCQIGVKKKSIGILFVRSRSDSWIRGSEQESAKSRTSTFKYPPPLTVRFVPPPPAITYERKTQNKSLSSSASSRGPSSKAIAPPAGVKVWIFLTLFVRENLRFDVIFGRYPESRGLLFTPRCRGDKGFW